jgi:hypothetical protein
MKTYNILIPVFNSVTYRSHIKDYLVINSNSKLIQEENITFAYVHVFSCINVALLLAIGQSLLCHLWLMLLKTGIEILHFYAVFFSYI